MKRLRSWLVLAIVVTVVFALSAGRTIHDAERPFTALRPAIDDFTVGWFDSLDRASALPVMAAHAANTVLPYFLAAEDGRAYLRAAELAGIKVLLEINRDVVRDGDAKSLTRFIKRYMDAPALYGWYLADEPSTTEMLGPLSAERATKLYRVIKAVDPAHPVAIAFSTGEDLWEYVTAMDVAMLDDYPFRPATPEFAALPAWWKRLTSRAHVGRVVGGFIPILQAFGGAKSPPGFSRRLPTAAEVRYMVFASIEAGATGILFWVWYRTDPRWAKAVVAPIMSEVRSLDAALRTASLKGSTSVDRRDVGLTMFRDPETNERVLILVHHGRGDVSARVALDASLRDALVTTAEGGPVEASSDEFVTVLRPFDVKVFRVHPATR
jgi:hypothetical protein